jgi:hypothetical protein
MLFLRATFQCIYQLFHCFWGVRKPGLLSIAIAPSGQPVAHTPQPKHRLVLTTGTFASPIVRASGGHRSMHVSQATQRSASNDGSNPELKTRPGLGCFKKLVDHLTVPTITVAHVVDFIGRVAAHVDETGFLAAAHDFCRFFLAHPPAPQPSVRFSAIAPNHMQTPTGIQTAPVKCIR